MGARKIIFAQKQSAGDILTLTKPISDFAFAYPDIPIDVKSPCPAIWENNPYLTPLELDDYTVEYYPIEYGRPGKGINITGWRGQHWNVTYHEDMEEQTGLEFPMMGIKPELFLSEDEKIWVNQVQVEFGWMGPFWLINAGWKPDNELKYYHRWQEVADLFNEHFRGSVRLVQIGHGRATHPKLEGIYDLVGKTDLRQLIRLGYWAHGTIGPLSFQFVMSAAFEQPHVVVAAGKEDVRWHLYPHGRYMYTNGALECCKWGGCWKGGKKENCADLMPGGFPRCFDMIKPYQIVDNVIMYYEGGVLSSGKRKMEWQC